MTQGDDANRPQRPALPPFARPGAAPQKPLRSPPAGGGDAGSTWAPFMPPATPGARPSGPGARPATPVRPLTPARPATPPQTPMPPQAPPPPQVHTSPEAPMPPRNPAPAHPAARMSTPPGVASMDRASTSYVPMVAPTLPSPAPLAAMPEDLAGASNDALESSQHSNATVELRFLDTGAVDEEDRRQVEALHATRVDLSDASPASSVRSPDTGHADPRFASALHALPTRLPVSDTPPADLESASDELVSYSEPAIAPASKPGRRPSTESLRVPDIPDLDLHVASALEAVAQRIRAGELHLPPLVGAGDEASSLSLALAALLAARH